MTHIKRRQMQMIGFPFLKLQDGTPLPLHTSQIYIAARRWCYDILPGVFILADSIFRRLILQMLGILLGGGFIGLISHVLVSDPVPADHPAEHEHTPCKRKHNPDYLGALDRFTPPARISWRGIRSSHSYISFI